MIQWYPGHMAKAKRILQEDLKLVDLVVEVLDARIPSSSRNPELDKILDGKDRILALNKSDLANPVLNREWSTFLEKTSPVVLLNSLQGEGIAELLKIIRQQGRKINEKVISRGRKARDIRIMILGIPNVGKSALINTLAGSNKAITGNKPGVTRGRQWIKVGENIQLLDTPGILWPKFDDEDTGYKLALTGAVRDEIFDREMAAYKLIEYLLKIDLDILEENYGIYTEGLIPYDIMPEIGRKRGCLMSGGRVDRRRSSEVLINEYRKGKLGRITLEKPVMEENDELAET